MILFNNKVGGEAEWFLPSILIHFAYAKYPRVVPLLPPTKTLRVHTCRCKSRGNVSKSHLTWSLYCVFIASALSPALRQPILWRITTRLSSWARPANNAYSTLLRDSSQHLLDTSVQAISTLNYIRFHLYLCYFTVFRHPYSTWKPPVDYLSTRGLRSATSHRRSSNTSQRKPVQADLCNPH